MTLTDALEIHAILRQAGPMVRSQLDYIAGPDSIHALVDEELVMAQNLPGFIELLEQLESVGVYCSREIQKCGRFDTSDYISG